MQVKYILFTIQATIFLLFFCTKTYSYDPKLQVQGELTTPNVTLDNTLTTDPVTNPQTGEIYYNTSTNKLRIYDGTTWQDLGGTDGPKTAASVIVSACNSSGISGSCPCDGTTVCANPKADFTCDGTDDNLIIQQAIDALKSNGGAVYLLEGTYNISGSIALDDGTSDGFNDSNKTIIGAGRGTVLRHATINFPMLNVSGINRILIANLMINGAGLWHASGGCGISFYTVADSKIENVWIENIRGNGYGIKLLAGSNNNTISGVNIITTDEDGILIVGDNNIISGNTVWQTSGWSAVYNITTASANNNIIANNYFYRSQTHGMYIGQGGASNNNIIVNNQVGNAGYQSCWRGEEHDGIVIANSTNNVIAANNVWSNCQDGILVSGTGANVVSDNLVRANRDSGIVFSSTSNNNVIMGNMSLDNGRTAYYGIHILSDNNLIASNSISDSIGIATDTNYGIYLEGTASDNYLTANFINGIGYVGAGYDRKIQDSGTNTAYTGKTKFTLEKKQIAISSSPYTLNVALSPQTYVSLNPSLNITLNIANGKASGDLLILENISANTVTINDLVGDNINLSGGEPRDLPLGQREVLELIWNGTQWLEVKWTDN